MTYSFNIASGDLSLAGPGGMDVVRGHDKLIQDLRCILLEPVGTDPMHPSYGSALDGGILPDGTIIETDIGSIITKKAALDLESEIRRVLLEYQQQQLARIRSEQMRYGSLFNIDPGEILLSIVDVQVRQISDTLIAKVIIRSADGGSFPLTLPVGNI